MPTTAAPRTPRLSAALLPLVLFLLAPAAAVAHETGSGTGGEFRDVVERIAGAASLLHDVDRGSRTRELHERAHHFEEMVARGARPNHFDRDWEELRRSFDEVRRRYRRGADPRVDFLVAHLEEEFAAANRVVGRYGSPLAGGGSTRGGGQIDLVRSETCVGVNRVGPKPCKSPRPELSFRLPNDVVVIRRVIGEWRDFGGGAKAALFVDGQPVWQTDVREDWDADGRDLNLTVRRGSVLTLRSAGGDPFWVRRLEIQYDATERGKASGWQW